MMRVSPNLKPNNYLNSVGDLSAEEIKNLLHLMTLLKNAEKQGVRLPLLKDKVLAMIFQINSTRTRVSFETAMTQLGGHAEFLSMSNLQIGEGHESMRDTAEVVSRMSDAVIMRCEDQAVMDEFIKYSYVPVFNGMTMDGHPTQVLADALTMIEHLPSKPVSQMVVMYMGDNKDDEAKLVPIQREMMWICAKLGMTYIACCPESMEPNAEDSARFERYAQEEKSDAKLVVSHDPYEHIEDVDFLVTDSFVYGMPEGPDRDERKATLMPYQINQALVDAGKPELGVLHCLPCEREVELTSEVLDGPNSLAFEEAENRLHAQKGILVWFMYTVPKPGELTAYHMAKVESFLSSVEREVPSAIYHEDHVEK